MSLPRFFLPVVPEDLREGVLVSLTLEAARHAQVLRLRPGDALELAWRQGQVWAGDVVSIRGSDWTIRLVRSLDENREWPVHIEACIPILAQLSALYFLIADSMARFHFLGKGLAVILVWIGVKMLSADFLKASLGISNKVLTLTSLGMIIGVLVLSILLSLRKPVSPKP